MRQIGRYEGFPRRGRMDGQHGIEADSEPSAPAEAQHGDNGAVTQSYDLVDPGRHRPRNIQELVFDYLAPSTSINLDDSQTTRSQSSHDLETTTGILNKHLVRI